ncbi:MAG TPA: tetratricopeptide repeat protein, partial [Pyrinomonadaceae bacterium]
MTTRKTVGWLVFAALAMIFILQVPRIAARGYISLGSSYFTLKRYEKAEKAYLHAKALADDSCAACGLGMTYNALGRYDDAEKEFQRSMRLDPNDACPYAQSGTMYYDLGKYK